jgi:hypothetical protein
VCAPLGCTRDTRAPEPGGDGGGGALTTTTALCKRRLASSQRCGPVRDARCGQAGAQPDPMRRASPNSTPRLHGALRVRVCRPLSRTVRGAEPQLGPCDPLRFKALLAGDAAGCSLNTAAPQVGAPLETCFSPERAVGGRTFFLNSSKLFFLSIRAQSALNCCNVHQPPPRESDMFVATRANSRFWVRRNPHRRAGQGRAGEGGGRTYPTPHTCHG